MSTPGNVIPARLDDGNVEYDVEVEYTRVGRRGVIENCELIGTWTYVGDKAIYADAIKQLEAHDRWSAGNVLLDRFHGEIQRQVDEHIELEEIFGAETEAERRWEAQTGR